MALSLQWFSQHDIWDGLRARRLKAGSPLGRIIDEALDMTQQASYCLWIGYLFRFDNIVLQYICILPNMVFYTMEMKFILLKNLKITLGEMGPVEIELTATILLLLGWYFGSEGL
jgi:phosphatidylglycerophosphate synthase